MKELIGIYLLFFISQNIFSQEKIFYGSPDWSSDGRFVAYVSNCSENREIYIYDLTEKNNKQVTSTGSSEWSPVWSPNGEYIAYVSNRSGDKEIYIYDVKSKLEKRITNSRFDKVMPSWKSDSKSILYIQENTDTNSKQIFSTNLDGETHNLTPDSMRNYIYPKLSPDDNLMIFSSRLKNSNQRFHIYSFDIQTKKLKQLEDLPIASYNPNWSANGEKIVFINQSNQNIESASIYIMNKDGSDLKKITDCEAGCFQPKISPDGDLIIYRDAWINGHKGIFTFNLSTSEIIKILGK